MPCPPLPARTGTSLMTTPGSRRRRTLSENSVRRERAASNDRRRKSSGMITVTKFDSPRGSAQRYSMTASARPSSGVRTSRSGRRSVSSRKRGRMPGSVLGPGAWIAWKRSPEILRRVRERLAESCIRGFDVEDNLVTWRAGQPRPRQRRHAVAAPPSGSDGSRRRRRAPGREWRRSPPRHPRGTSSG